METTDKGKNKLITTLSKSATEDVRLTLRLYNGNIYIDLRTWMATLEGPIPTRKGVQIDRSQLKKLIGGLNEIDAMFDKILNPKITEEDTKEIFTRKEIDKEIERLSEKNAGEIVEGEAVFMSREEFAKEIADFQKQNEKGK